MREKKVIVDWSYCLRMDGGKDNRNLLLFSNQIELKLCAVIDQLVSSKLLS